MTGSDRLRCCSRSAVWVVDVFASRLCRWVRVGTAVVWVWVSFAAVCGVGVLIGGSIVFVLVSDSSADALGAVGRYSCSAVRSCWRVWVRSRIRG